MYSSFLHSPPPNLTGVGIFAAKRRWLLLLPWMVPLIYGDVASAAAVNVSIDGDDGGGGDDAA